SKKLLEAAFQNKETELSNSVKQREELEEQIKSANNSIKEKEFIQEKYEQLKEEWIVLSKQLEESVEIRLQSDQLLNQLEAIAANQECQLQDFSLQIEGLNQEKSSLETERTQLSTLLEES